MKTQSPDALQVSQPSKGQAQGLHRRGRWIGVIGIIVAVGSAGAALSFRTRALGTPKSGAQTELKKFAPPTTYPELCSLPLADVAKCDIALLNLLCSEGLKGSESPSIPQCLATIDQWTSHIRTEIERNLHRYWDAPDKFRKSEGYFRMTAG
jgi:hypothetical protein